MATAQLKRAFRTFDKNGDGYLSHEELRFLLTSLGDSDGQFTSDEADIILNQYDSDHDGRINIDEFVAMMACGDAAPRVLALNVCLITNNGVTPSVPELNLGEARERAVMLKAEERRKAQKAAKLEAERIASLEAERIASIDLLSVVGSWVIPGGRTLQIEVNTAAPYDGMVTCTAVGVSSPGAVEPKTDEWTWDQSGCSEIWQYKQMEEKGWEACTLQCRCGITEGYMNIALHEPVSVTESGESSPSKVLKGFWYDYDYGLSNGFSWTPFTADFLDPAQAQEKAQQLVATAERVQKAVARCTGLTRAEFEAMADDEKAAVAKALQKMDQQYGRWTSECYSENKGNFDDAQETEAEHAKYMKSLGLYCEDGGGGPRNIGDVENYFDLL